jgi:hypothetical protein
VRSSRNYASKFSFRTDENFPFRYCSRCEERLPVEAFAIDRSKPSGRKSACKQCDRERAREYY